MLFNEDLLFIHPVKTGGITLSHFLLSRLKTPIMYVVQKGHHGKYNNWSGVLSLIGNRHGNLPYARDLLKQFANFSIENFKVIISVIRNPYTLEISRFYYFAKDMDWIDPEAPEVILARQGNFETFAREAPYNYCPESGYSAIQHYYTLEGKIPDNLHLLRFENLEQDLQKAISDYKINLDSMRPLKKIAKRDVFRRPIGLLQDTLSILKLYKPCRLPQLNSTKKNKTLQDLITPEAELEIYKKYQWIFDNGYYKRISF